jgi:D-lactate dehydrogenase (cytochrome)
VLPPFETDPDVVSRYLEDAAHYPGGYASAVVRPSSVTEISAVVRSATRVLVVGAQSSLTGGATPAGDLVVSTERLQGARLDGDLVTVGAGVTLEALQQELAGHGVWLPPVPTFLGATAGGAASTNAAGAATFKYGTTRDWVEGLTVVFADGEVRRIRRGDMTASAAGWFELATASGSMRVPVPDIRMPDVPKCSAGYFSAPRMDLVDLFVGSEGTLGAIADVTFRVQPRPGAVCMALVPMADEARGIALVEALRLATRATWDSRDPRGIDIAAIEHIDARALAILKEDGVDRRLRVSLPTDTALVLLVQLELAGARSTDNLWSELASARSDDSSDGPLTRFVRLLDDFDALDAEIVLPDNASRRDALIQFREATPASVNRRVALAQAQVDGRIHKTAADSVVPFDRFADMMRTCRRLFAERGVDLAVWGHISDGNVHPNVVPTSYRDIEEGKAIMLELGREVIAMGGSPLAEHGVGRSAMKQELLRMLYGDAGIASMRQVKRALDPSGKLARGVLFPFSESA